MRKYFEYLIFFSFIGLIGVELYQNISREAKKGSDSVYYIEASKVLEDKKSEVQEEFNTDSFNFNDVNP